MADPAFQQTVETLADAVSKNPGSETAVVTEAMRFDSRICGLFDPNSAWNAYFKQRIEFYRALHAFQQQAALPPPPPPPPTTSISSFKEMLSQHTHDLSRFATTLNLGDTEGSNLVAACLNLIQETKEQNLQEFEKLYSLVRQLVELSSHELKIPGLFSVRKAMTFQAPTLLSALMVQAAQVDASCKSKVLELVKLATSLQVIPPEKKVHVQQQVVAASLPVLGSILGTPSATPLVLKTTPSVTNEPVAVEPKISSPTPKVPPVGRPIDQFSVGEMVTLLKREYQKNRTTFMPYTPIDSKGAFERAPPKEPLTINIARRIEDLYSSLGENHSVPFNLQAPDQFDDADTYGRNSKRFGEFQNYVVNSGTGNEAHQQILLTQMITI
eukprot:GHVP01051506.1.p1 GENE.GHVP01051506.1~~GHVP01051506.1.p1  ORF type:complete len:395 (-),score=68.99 GHVP01051506.1:1953-3104(-)